MGRWSDAVYTACSVIWAVTPFLIFFILISVFINSTDRPIRGGEWRRSVPVDLLASSLEEADSWGCFAEHVPVDVQNLVQIGTTVLVELGKAEDGIYMALPTTGGSSLSFLKMKQTVPGESYKILRGLHRSREIVIQDFPVSTANTLINPHTPFLQRTLLISQLPAEVNSTGTVLTLEIGSSQTPPERVMVVNDVEHVDEVRLNLQQWVHCCFVELVVLNLSSRAELSLSGFSQSCNPLPPLSVQNYFVSKGQVYSCTTYNSRLEVR